MHFVKYSQSRVTFLVLYKKGSIPGEPLGNASLQIKLSTFSMVSLEAEDFYKRDDKEGS